MPSSDLMLAFFAAALLFAYTPRPGLLASGADSAEAIIESSFETCSSIRVVQAFGGGFVDGRNSSAIGNSRLLSVVLGNLLQELLDRRPQS